SATLYCKMRSNAYVELAHWIHQILQEPDSDIHRLAQHFEVDAGRLSKDLLRALDQLPRGATAVSDLSVHVEESVERAWIYASLLFGAKRIRTGHLVVGWLKTPVLRNVVLSISSEFKKLKADELTDSFAALTAASPEADSSPSQATDSEETSGSPAPAVLG